MIESNDSLMEQLSAYMDGELPEAEARFLQRRLEHDLQLRALWSRMQVASTCIKGQPWLPMRESIANQVQAEIGRSASTRIRRPMLRWALAASVAALAVVFAPRLMQSNAPVVAVNAVNATHTVAPAAAPAADHVLASPASADLVAERAPSDATAAAIATPAARSVRDADFIASNPKASAKESPMPLSSQSPTDFPLIDSGDKRSWPKSDLIGAANDPAIEAYLVRHNQMLANDGLGGFVPYVDVVSSQQPATSADKASSTQDGEADQQ
jgi:hypothetical protein